MALLNTWGKYNKVFNIGKTILYSKRKITGLHLADSTVPPLGPYVFYECWEYTRDAKMSFEYVGMDFDTAQDCVEDLNDYFTRQTKISKWIPENSEFTDQDGGDILMTSVQMQKMQGDMYKVTVNVNEHDVKRRIASYTPSLLFTFENQREYLEDED